MFSIEGNQELALLDLSGRVKPLSIYTLNGAPRTGAWPEFLASLLSWNESGDIAGGISDHGQLRTARHFGWRQDRLAAEFLHFFQRRLQVLDLGVHRDALAAVLVGADAAIDSSGAATGIDYAVLHRVVAVDLPSKQLGVELLELILLSTHDLEMNDRCSH